MISRGTRTAGLALLALAPVGCRREVTPAPTASSAPSAAAAPSAATPDRLRPGELAPGVEELFGLLLPRGMKVVARLGGAGHATGPLPPEDVAAYLKGHLDPPNAELGAAGTLFPGVKLRGGAAERLYRVEVRASGSRGTELIVRDVTPVPKREKDPSITDEERWRRAGFHPDGTPLDRNRLR